MSEYELVAVDHKLSALQNQRTTYVHKLTALDPQQDGEHIATYLKLIEDVNAAMVRVSRAMAPHSAL